MFKKYTMIALGMVLMGGEASGMSSLRRLRTPASAVAALGAAGSVVYFVEKSRELVVDKALESFPDLDAANSAAIKQMLTDKVPADLDKGLIESVVFKQLPANKNGVGLEYAMGYKDRKMIAVTTEPLPSDFLLLHELGHHYYNHHVQTKIFTQTAYAASIGVFLYYLLNSAAKKRFVLAPALWILSNKSAAISLQALCRYQEIQADQFATTRLKNRGDLNALELAKADLLAAQPIVEQQLTARLGLSKAELAEIESQFKLKADWLKFCADPHPDTKDRVQKIELAIAELRAQKDRAD